MTSHPNRSKNSKNSKNKSLKYRLFDASGRIIGLYAREYLANVAMAKTPGSYIVRLLYCEDMIDRRCTPGLILQRATYSYEEPNSERRNPYTYGTPSAVDPKPKHQITAFAHDMRALRHRLKLGQAAFGKLFGVTATTIWRWEHDHRQPSAAVLILLRHLSTE